MRVYLPNERMPFWRVRAETQNRPLVRELELDASTGAVLRDKGFDGKPMLDRVIGVGIAAHEGQLFGIANQLLGLFTALGLITMCVSAVVMWWRRRPEGALGVPAPRVEGFTIGAPLIALIVCARNPSSGARRLAAGALGHYATGGARRRLSAALQNFIIAIERVRPALAELRTPAGPLRAR